MATRNPIQEMLTTLREMHRVDSKVVTLADDTFDLEATEMRCLVKAVHNYSKKVPRKMVKKITNGNSSIYTYALKTYIPTWNSNYTLTVVKYPLDDPSVEKPFLDRNWVEVTPDDDTGDPLLRFIKGQPDGPFVIWYLAPHSFDVKTKTTSIPESEEETVCWYAAYLMLEFCANELSKFRSKKNQTAISDSLDFGELVDRYRTAADRALKQFNDGIDEDEEAIGPGFVDLDIDSAYGKFFFHPEQYR